MDMNMSALDDAVLSQFTGTENYWKHPLQGFKMTDGSKHIAENAGCYWLIDKIAYSQLVTPFSKNQDFQVWKLVTDLDKMTAKLTCDDGNGNILSIEHIDYTDFPLEGMTFYYQHGVLMLTSEY
jgi:hypothetical protein